MPGMFPGTALCELSSLVARFGTDFLAGRDFTSSSASTSLFPSSTLSSSLFGSGSALLLLVLTLVFAVLSPS